MDGSTRHDPDYILNNFTTTRTDINGNLKYVLSAAEMKHYPDDDTTELQKPHFTQFSVEKPYTKVESDRGFVSSDGENVQFLGNVKVVRQAFKDRGEMTVTTDFLDVVPDKEIATTDRPVTIHQAPDTVIHASGMIYDKKQKTLQLKSRVRAHYVKPPAPQAGRTAAKPAKAASKPASQPAARTVAKPKTQTGQTTKPANNSTRIRRTYEPASP